MDLSKELVDAILNEDFDKTYSILEENYKNCKNEDYVESLINFIMSHPDIDYGMPGPVVHYIEKYPTDYYVVKLLKAIEQKPNDTLLWMLNRIVNDTYDENKEKYISIFKNTIERKDIDDITKEVAERFYNYQKFGN